MAMQMREHAVHADYAHIRKYADAILSPTVIGVGLHRLGLVGGQLGTGTNLAPESI